MKRKKKPKMTLERVHAELTKRQKYLIPFLDLRVKLIEASFQLMRTRDFKIKELVRKSLTYNDTKGLSSKVKVELPKDSKITKVLIKRVNAKMELLHHATCTFVAFDLKKNNVMWIYTNTKASQAALLLESVFGKDIQFLEK